MRVKVGPEIAQRFTDLSGMKAALLTIAEAMGRVEAKAWEAIHAAHPEVVAPAKYDHLTGEVVWDEAGGA